MDFELVDIWEGAGRGERRVIEFPSWVTNHDNEFPIFPLHYYRIVVEIMTTIYCNKSRSSHPNPFVIVIISW